MNHIDTLKEMRGKNDQVISSAREYHPSPTNLELADEVERENVALTFAIQTLEMVEASSSIYFGNDYICRLGSNPFEYGLYAKGEAGHGDYSSYYEAFTDLQEKA